MVMAKGVAGGLPVGATVTTDEIASKWSGKTISTFGGNPICMAAMAETLKVMEEENVPARAVKQGGQLRAGLEALAEKYQWIGEVRGMGLMQALELVKDRKTKEPFAERTSAFMETAKKEGLLIGKAGLMDNVLRFGPSLLVTEDEVADCLARTARVCATLDAS